MTSIKTRKQRYNLYKKQEKKNTYELHKQTENKVHFNPGMIPGVFKWVP